MMRCCVLSAVTDMTSVEAICEPMNSTISTTSSAPVALAVMSVDEQEVRIPGGRHLVLELVPVQQLVTAPRRPAAAAAAAGRRRTG